MRRPLLAVLLLTLAVLSLGVLLAAAEAPDTAKDSPPVEDDYSLPEEQKEKIALVPDNGAHTGPLVCFVIGPSGITPRSLPPTAEPVSPIRLLHPLHLLSTGSAT